MQYQPNHLLYLDDINIKPTTEREMKGLLQISTEISTNIKMEFGINNSKMLHIEKARWKEEAKK